MTSKRLSMFVLAFGLSIFASPASAQVPPAKPNPELAKMSIFLGKWRLEEESDTTPFGPAAKLTYDTDVRFIHNGFFLEESGKAKKPDGAFYTYSIQVYFDPTEKSLRSFITDSDGVAVPTIGTLEGRTWKNLWVQQAKGKEYKCKGVSTVAADGKTFNYEWLYSEDGVTWNRTLRGTATKIADAPKELSSEQKKLEMMVGRWKFDEENFESPLGSAGKGSFTSEAKLILAGTVVEEKGEGKGPGGPYSWTTLMSYESGKGKYLGFTFDSTGFVSRPWNGEVALGTFSENTWTWTWNQEIKDKTYQMKSTAVFSPDAKSSIYQLSFSEDGSDWKVAAKGTGQKLPDAPKVPGLEHKKLEAIAGKWKHEEVVFESPFGPAGNVTGTGDNRMILGGFYVECHSKTTGPTGDRSSVEIIAYDSDKACYQDAFFSSTGDFDQFWKGQYARATVDGNTWHWTWTEEIDGKTYSIRQDATYTPDGKTCSWETQYSEDGVDWKTRSQAKESRID